MLPVAIGADRDILIAFRIQRFTVHTLSVFGVYFHMASAAGFRYFFMEDIGSGVGVIPDVVGAMAVLTPGRLLVALGHRLPVGALQIGAVIDVLRRADGISAVVTSGAVDSFRKRAVRNLRDIAMAVSAGLAGVYGLFQNRLVDKQGLDITAVFDLLVTGLPMADGAFLQVHRLSA